ncbi:MAG: hypothetical protein WKG00_17725 [Polyangiaceae bacterium]
MKSATKPLDKAMSRRRMLRGLAGGSAVLVGLPILDAMLDSHGTAFADGGPRRKRLVTWCFGNGVILDNWVPGGIRNPVTGYGYRSATRWRRCSRCRSTSASCPASTTSRSTPSPTTRG